MWMDRGIITILTGVYLYVFRTIIPSGDGLVYVRDITEGLLLWNPNHLLMSPVGYWWCTFLWKIGISITVINALKVLSGIASVLTLLIFYEILKELGINSRSLKLICVAGLLFSKNFLSMSISEEYFMIQMPFLLLTIWIFAHWMKARTEANKHIMAMGTAIAMAIAIQINNLPLLLLMTVLFVMIELTQQRKISIRSFLSSSAGFSLLIILFGVTYFLSGTNETILDWLSSYQGKTSNSVGMLYGLNWSGKGLAESFTRLLFNLVSNLIYVGGLGAILKNSIFMRPYDFRPDPVEVVLGAFLFIMVLLLVAMIGVWLIRYRTKNIFARFSLLWVVSYLIFNLYWNDSSDQFWFQILPIFWILLPLSYTATGCEPRHYMPVVWRRIFRPSLLLFIIVSQLMFINTLFLVLPKSYVDLASKQEAHRIILRDGDLVILPGWDDLYWLSSRDNFPVHKRITLMELALKSAEGEEGMKLLPQIVAGQLNEGKRVIVVRLYDLDYTSRPWDQLRKIGWPREKIQDLLDGYRNKDVGRVGDVVFREILL